MKITLQGIGLAVGIAALTMASAVAQAPATTSAPSATGAKSATGKTSATGKRSASGAKSASGSKSASSKSATGAKSASGVSKTAATAKASAEPDPTLLKPELLVAKAPAEFDVTFTTTKGDIVIHVTREWSPNGADRFYNLVRHHYFNGVAFFRNVKGFMVQFGLSPSGEVNKAWMNHSIKDDPIKPGITNDPGYLTFAKTGAPNSRGTQLFINHKNNGFLDGQGFTPIGKVTSGLEIVEQLYDGYGESPDQGQITANGKKYLEPNFPKLDLIKSATISGLPAPAAKTGAAKASTGAAKKP
jgi:peptidyl-prolyl cis-trans isomerase A (cyclophilin A)